MRKIIQTWWTPFVLLLFFSVSVFLEDSRVILYIPSAFLGALFFFNAYAKGESRFTSLRAPEVLLPGVAISALAFLSIVISREPYTSLYASYSYAILFLSLAVLAHMPFERAMKQLVWLALPFTLLASYGIYQHFKLHDYPRGPYFDSNVFGGLMLAGTVMCAGFLMDARRQGKKGLALLLPGLPLVLTAAVGFYTSSRGAWLSLVVSLLLVTWAFIKHLNLNKKHIVAALAVLCVIGTVSAVIKIRHETVERNGYSQSLNSRVAILESAVHMVETHPAWGIGWGLWSTKYPDYRLQGDVDSQGTSAHNDYLESWATGGMLGFLAVLTIPFLLGLAVRRARSAQLARPWIVWGGASAAALLCIQAGVNFIFNQMATAIVIGLGIGLVFSAARSKPVTDKAALPVRKQLLAALPIPVVVLVSTWLYLTTTFSSLISNPFGFETMHLAWITQKPMITWLQKYNYHSIDAYFYQAHVLHVKGAVSKDPATKKKLYDEALHYYRLADQQSNDFAGTPFREAIIMGDYPGLSKEERYQRAEAYFKESLRRSPTFAPAASEYARLLVKSGRKAEAAKVMDRAILGGNRFIRQEMTALKAKLLASH